MADLGRCELADWAIKESLRLNAAAPVLWRRSVRPFEFGGHAFPEGTITGVNPMLTHLLPEIWEDPGRYDPLRFSPERSRGRHRFAFVPFGGGAHGCLGANFAYLQVRAPCCAPCWTGTSSSRPDGAAALVSLAELPAARRGIWSCVGLRPRFSR